MRGVYVKTVFIEMLSLDKFELYYTFNAYCSLHNLDIGVIYDAPGTIQKTNQLINTNFILLNSENEIITKENPLENSKTKKLYKKLSSSPQ